MWKEVDLTPRRDTTFDEDVRSGKPLDVDLELGKLLDMPEISVEDQAALCKPERPKRAAGKPEQAHRLGRRPRPKRKPGTTIEQKGRHERPFPSSPARRRRGAHLIKPGTDNAETLAAYLLENLAGMGFGLHEGEIVQQDDPSKDHVRNLHAVQRAEAFRKNAEHVDRHLDDIAPFFCNGADIDPLKIDPFIRPVTTTVDGALFRAATMLWSVPVSQGYGRRTRFLICDRQNGALIGVFALGDPVFNLGVRDRLIGWDHRDREHRLYQCFDAFVLGAVPPYRELLGGKLAALCAISNETRRYLERKYAGAVTKIRKETKASIPVLISTTSALGRSSIYNRLKWGQRKLYYSVGYTEGFGHFHIPDHIFAALVSFLDTSDSAEGHQYGDGPNYRMRVTRSALNKLGLNPDLMRHGVKREVFLAPVAHNWREVLRGEETEVDRVDLPLGDLAQFFVSRWAFPRAMRDQTYKTVTASATIELIRPGAGITMPLLGDTLYRGRSGANDSVDKT